MGTILTADPRTRMEMLSAYDRAAAGPVQEERLQLARDRFEANNAFRQAEQERKIQASSMRAEDLQKTLDWKDRMADLRESQIKSENAKRDADMAQQTLKNNDTAKTATAAAKVFQTMMVPNLDEVTLRKAIADNPEIINNSHVMDAVQHKLDLFANKKTALAQNAVVGAQKSFDEAKAGIAANQAVIDGLKDGTPASEKTVAALALNHQKLIDSGNRLIKADPTSKDSVTAAWQEQHSALEPLASGASPAYDKTINGYKKALGYAPIVRSSTPASGDQVAAAPAASQTPEERVKVIAPNGAVGHIPKSQLETAVQSGYTVQ